MLRIATELRKTDPPVEHHRDIEGNRSRTPPRAAGPAPSASPGAYRRRRLEPEAFGTTFPIVIALNITVRRRLDLPRRRPGCPGLDAGRRSDFPLCVDLGLSAAG